MEKIRSFVRPFLTVTGWVVLLYLAIKSDGDIKQYVVGAVTLMIGYWFGERKK